MFMKSQNKGNDSDYYDVRGIPLTRTSQNPKPCNPLRRPEINLKKPAYYILFLLFLLVLVYLVSGVVFVGGTKLARYQIISVIVVAVIYVYMISRKTIIWFVHLYQHFAPDRIRLRCVYEPSCSEYMILAVRKYGSVRGIWKGVCRLIRCHPPNHGADYP